MSIKKLIIGNTTEALLNTLFNNRISEESTSNDFNSNSRAIKIKDLKNQIIGYMKRNPNSRFTVIAPEFKSEKQVKLQFNNFLDEEDDDDSVYVISIEDNFVTAEIIKIVEIGNNIKLTLRGT